jgi:predicted small metal-binding protein
MRDSSFVPEFTRGSNSTVMRDRPGPFLDAGCLIYSPYRLSPESPLWHRVCAFFHNGHKAFASPGLKLDERVHIVGLGKDEQMSKIVDCAKVDPSTGCSHVVRGETEEELMKNAAEHAREHGIVEVTPELMERVRANIQDE